LIFITSLRKAGCIMAGRLMNMPMIKVQKKRKKKFIFVSSGGISIPPNFGTFGVAA
jgi:hypothetical protein